MKKNRTFLMFWRSTLCIGFLFLGSTPAVFADASHSNSKLGEINFPTPFKLGKINFPTSGSKEAQKHFLQGVAALHSFWYAEAVKAFRHATQLDPGFIMGYWGEAMAFNHVLWEDQDTEAAREVLAKIKDPTQGTARERAFLDAVRLLYGEGEKKSRDAAYANAMQQLYHDYPEDLEAACFYALSLLGVARNSENKLRLQVQAGEIGLKVFRKNPNHPCAAHYTIHAFDHPDLASRALPAARRYAQIAPDSHHAQHMPAHIFVQLGLWPEAASANEAAWQNSVAWVERENLSIGQRDYHSLQWLHYVYLQEGRYEKADRVFRLKIKDITDAGENTQALHAKTNGRTAKYLERMVGASVFERERWQWMTTFKEPPSWQRKPYVQAVLNFVRGFAAAMQGQADAEKYLAQLKTIRSEGFSQNYFKRPEQLEIWELELQAAIAVTNKNYEAAIALMEQATAIEEKLPGPSGPPRIIKPTYELFGEILLRADKPKNAAQQFATCLSRHPNRARSLLGAARAAAKQGDRAEAAGKYSQLLALWKQADPMLPELHEAKFYLEQP